MRRSILSAAAIILFFSAPLPFVSGESAKRLSGPLIARGDYDFPPFEFIDENGKPSGFNVELIEAVSREMGIEIIVDLDLWSTVTEELEAGEVDMLTGMFQTEKRELSFDFSAPHNVITHAIYTRKGSDITSLEDLKGRTVLVQTGDVMEEYLRDRLPGAVSVPTLTYREALASLNGGTPADAALVSRIQAEYLIQEDNLKQIEAVGPPLYPRKYCFAVREGDSDLIAVLNDGLALVRENGEYDRLYAKWFGSGSTPLSRLLSFRNILLVTIPAAVLAALIASWIWSLRSTVRQKTAELEKELAERKAAEWRFRSVFEGVPVSIWEEDFSAVRERIEQLRARGVTDFRAYIDEHPELIKWMIENIRIIDVNPATLAMHEVDSKEQLLGSFSKVNTDEIHDYLAMEFVAIAEGKQYLQDETVTTTFKGNEKTFLTTIFIPRAGSRAFSHMLVSMVDITDIKIAEKKLEQALAEKNVLLKELHHRVKNNMQLMSSLINLQSRSVEDEKLSQIIRVSENRIRAMALIHELLYQTDDFSSVEIGFYLRTLARTVMDSFSGDAPSRVRLESETDEAYVSIDTAIPCGLIVNELVSNAMEHAFDEESGGIIRLNIKREESGLTLEISDNGRGFASPEERKKAPGTMGLTLVEALGSQLGGTLEKESAPGKGTRYLLTLGGRHLVT